MFVAIFIMFTLSFLYSFLKKHSPKQLVSLSIFTAYLVFVLVAIVGFPALSQSLKDGAAVFNPDIRLIPFEEGFGILDVLNILLFVPFGFFVALLYKNGHSFWHVVYLGFSFTVLIEVGQLFTHYRVTDITDLVMNTLGAAIGYFLFKQLRMKDDLQLYPLEMIYSIVVVATVVAYVNT